jgi:hypothetical protein
MKMICIKDGQKKHIVDVEQFMWKGLQLNMILKGGQAGTWQMKRTFWYFKE